VCVCVCVLLYQNSSRWLIFDQVVQTDNRRLSLGAHCSS